MLGGVILSSNFDGIKTRKYGIEIEMTGLTRSQAAKAIANVLDGRVEHKLASVYYNSICD